MSYTGAAQVWDPAGGMLRRSFSVTRWNTSIVVFSPDASVVAVADRDGAKLWDVERGRLRHVLPTTRRVTQLAFSVDGTSLAVLTYDGDLQLWDPRSGELRRSRVITPYPDASMYRPMDGPIAFSPDGTMLAVSQGIRVELRDVTSGRTQHSFQVGITPIRSMAFSPDGSILGTLGSDNIIRLWNLSTLLER